MKEDPEPGCPHILDSDPATWFQHLVKLPGPSFRAKQVREWVFAKAVLDPDEMTK